MHICLHIFNQSCQILKVYVQWFTPPSLYFRHDFNWFITKSILQGYICSVTFVTLVIQYGNLLTLMSMVRDITSLRLEPYVSVSLTVVPLSSCLGVLFFQDDLSLCQKLLKNFSTLSASFFNLQKLILAISLLHKYVTDLQSSYLKSSKKNCACWKNF